MRIAFTEWRVLPRVSGIYCIRHIVSGREYIGSAADFRHRLHRHFRDIRSGKHHSPFLQRAFVKYGMEAFEVEIIEECVPSVLLIREQAQIDSRRPVYNIAPLAKSCAGVKHSAKTRKVRKIASLLVWSKRGPEERKEWGEQSRLNVKAWEATAPAEWKEARSQKAKDAWKRRRSAMSESEFSEFKVRMNVQASRAGEARAKQFSESDHEALLSAQKEWRKNNPQEVKAATERMRATKARRTPEQKAEALRKFRETMERKRHAA